MTLILIILFYTGFISDEDEDENMEEDNLSNDSRANKCDPPPKKKARLNRNNK